MSVVPLEVRNSIWIRGFYRLNVFGSRRIGGVRPSPQEFIHSQQCSVLHVYRTTGGNHDYDLLYGTLFYHGCINDTSDVSRLPLHTVCMDHSV